MLWMEKLFNKLKIFSGWNQPFWIKFVEVEVFRKKLFLKILQSLQEDTFRLYTCEFIKNSNWHRCFLLNFTKFLKNLFCGTPSYYCFCVWQFLTQLQFLLNYLATKDFLNYALFYMIFLEFYVENFKSSVSRTKTSICSILPGHNHLCLLIFFLFKQVYIVWFCFDSFQQLPVLF